MSLNSRNYSQEVVDHVWIDAGAVYINTKFEDGAFTTGEKLGATEGGNEFTLNAEIRHIAVDGVKGSAVGHNVIESVQPVLKVNLKEITARNLAMAIAGSEVDSTNEAYDIISGTDFIKLEEYVSNIALVGRIGTGGTRRDGIIVLENVLQKEPVAIKTSDKGEVVMTLTFEAHYTADHINTGRHPYKIYYPKEVTTV
ncbi:hypothetical protein [Psychrobacillus sp. BM2]|uniref:hypothetical protein n=1 Tax=Psychrobacillus sp. BM2 TaxID=3400421 RepID=UPI003B01FA10